MINPEVAVPLVVVFVAAAALVQRWMEHRERMAAIAAEAHRPPEDAARQTRLEQAIDTIALETERLGEGQRYLTRLLAERAERDGHAAVRPRSHERVDTPH
ncbi:MAG: hypothetical protein ABJA80_17620 [bacterium]